MIDRRGILGGVACLAGAPAAAAAASPPVRRLYAASRHGQVHLRQSGAARGRPPLLCFHQVPNSSQVFAAVMPHLAAQRRVFAFDTPGYGMSDHAPDPQTIAAYAEGLGDAIASLGLSRRPVDLLGYHTGAAIAAELIHQRRVAARRVVLAAVPVFTAEERARFGALAPIPFDEDGDWAREEWRRSWFWRGPGQTRESVLRTYGEKMRPGARERGAAAIAAYDMAGALQGLAQPLMILRPRDDLWEATARAIALRPDARSLDLPDLGHGMWDVAPERLANLLESFLSA